MKLSDIKDVLLTITDNVHHYSADGATGNYIVWSEDGQGEASYADNHMTMQTIQGTIDYFTKTEFDPVFDEIQAKLNSIDITWRLNSIQYEENTDYTHYEWVFGVVNDIG